MLFKIKIICLGKFKEAGFVGLENEYLKRLRPYAKVELKELREVPYETEDMVQKVKAEEGKLILKHISADSIVIILEEKGFMRSSVEFSEFMERLGSLGRELVFVIGSGVGLGDEVRARANHVISLSPLTFTHNFARVLLEEQIYRSAMILTGRKYHKA